MKIEDFYQWQQHPSLLAALVLFISMMIFFVFKRKIQQVWKNYRTRSLLNRLANKQYKQWRCPDGLGYHFIIDRVLLRPDGISLLVYNKFPGKIFCAENIDEWTQMLGQKSYRFKNPLHDLDCKIKAVKACVPDVDVDGFLFFDQQTEFPKGYPDRVIFKGNMPEMLTRSKTKVQKPVLAAWQKLGQLAV
ncbi:MAG: hypothetical protein GQ549_07450 [Gammaproteobacteria bacterium]|nr:hypothetical protein [Gammaproteobacteria bacterium]